MASTDEKILKKLGYTPKNPTHNPFQQLEEPDEEEEVDVMLNTKDSQALEIEQDEVLEPDTPEEDAPSKQQPPSPLFKFTFFCICPAYNILCMALEVALAYFFYFQVFNRNPLPTFELVTHNLNHKSFLSDLYLASAFENCKDGYFLTPLGEWPGSSTGCFCEQDDSFIKGECSQDSPCNVEVPSTQRAQLYEYDATLHFCTQKFDFQNSYKALQCKGNDLECSNFICVEEGESCPITSFELGSNEDELVLKSSKTEPPIIGLQLEYYQKVSDKYPLLNSVSQQPLPGTVRPMINATFSNILSSNGLKSVTGLPLFTEYLDTVNISARSQIYLKPDNQECFELSSVLQETIQAFNTPFWLAVVGFFAVWMSFQQVINPYLKRPLQSYKLPIYDEVVTFGVFHVGILFMLTIFLNRLSYQRELYLNSSESFHSGIESCVVEQLQEKLLNEYENCLDGAGRLVGDYQFVVLWLRNCQFVGLLFSIWAYFQVRNKQNEQEFA